MIKAKKSKIVMWMFSLVQKRQVKSFFATIYVKDDRPSDVKGLYYINHSTWWDPMILTELHNQKIIDDLYVMTHINGMKKVPLFRYIGAYSIDPTSGSHVKASLNYSKELLQSQKSVCLFPQGEELPLDIRPLNLQQGLAMIALRSPETPVIPVAFYYILRHQKKAEAWVSIGEPVYIDPSLKRQQLTAYFEQLLIQQLDTLKQDVLANDTSNYRGIL
jgi:1-acyl-sn-glycerol-3-phosphate acyltransferase